LIVVAGVFVLLYLKVTEGWSSSQSTVLTAANTKSLQ
jgi:hypothetical protein